jgi:DNA-binding MarR family transcriptional regulator
LDRGIISTSISKLTKGKYVEKMRSPQDGRVYLLELTSEGRVLFEKLYEQEQELIGFMMESSTINEQKAVLKFLSRVNQTMVGKYKLDETNI